MCNVVSVADKVTQIVASDTVSDDGARACSKSRRLRIAGHPH